MTDNGMVFRQWIQSKDGHVMVQMKQGNQLELKFLKPDYSPIAGEKILLTFRQAGKLAKLINHALATRKSNDDFDYETPHSFTHLKFWRIKNER